MHSNHNWDQKEESWQHMSDMYLLEIVKARSMNLECLMKHATKKILQYAKQKSTKKNNANQMIG